MRFKPSQTTPSYLNRSFQLRILSYVGFISVVMVTFGILDANRLKNRRDAVQERSRSADEANFEVRRQNRTLKPNEVVIVATPNADGTIELGGSADESDDPHIQLVSDQAEPFKSRKLERTDDAEMFRPRSKRTVRDSVDVFEDHDALNEMLNSSDDSPFDDVRGSKDVDAITLDRDRLIESTRSFDENDGVSESLLRKRNEFDDDETPTRPSPTFDEREVDLEEFERPRISVPSRPKRFDNDLSESRDWSDALPASVDHRKTPLRRPSRTFDDSELEAAGRFIPSDERDDRYVPTDRRRHNDMYMSDDSQPFEEDDTAVKIDKRYLGLIHDNDVGIRHDEAGAFYWLLYHARKVTSSRLDRAGSRHVQYSNLISDPDRFRGEPITIEGDLWRLREFDAGTNRYGLDRLYEGWVFTGDSGHHPFRIVCTSLGAGIEPGVNLRRPVRITGYFFKREGYQSNGGVHIAPTLLAHRISINPMPNGIPLLSGVVPYTIGAIMAVGLALLVTVIGFAISDERSLRSGLTRWRHSPQLSFAGLAVPTPVSIEDSLKDYAERQRQAAISGAYGPLLSRQTAREHAVREYMAPPRTWVDDTSNRRLRQSTIVQDWTDRQKDLQSENAAFEPTGSARPNHMVEAVDELDSDQFAPARHRLKKTPTYDEPRELKYSKTAISLTSKRNGDERTESISTESYRLTTDHAKSNVIEGSSISYGASKLSEWEDEIAKMTKRGQSHQSNSTSFSATKSLEFSAASQLEQDRLARESEIRERMTRQQSETERMRLEQIDYDRVERERSERERIEREQSEHDRIHRERKSFEHRNHEYDSYGSSQSSSSDHQRQSHRHDHSSRQQHPEQDQDYVEEYEDDELIDNDATEYRLPDTQAVEGETTPRKRRGGWGWPRRKKTSVDGESETPTAEPESPEIESDETGLDSEGHSSTNHSSWGRRRNRRRRRRDGESS